MSENEPMDAHPIGDAMKTTTWDWRENAIVAQHMPKEAK